MTRQLRGLRALAAEQLGTSGAGNHFAELVVGEALPGVEPTDMVLPRQFCGLLTHSGSRGGLHAPGSRGDGGRGR